jgi:transcriptional regulator of arginine metabolism
MAGKRERHTVILELVDGRPVATQEDLRRLLRQRGLDVTQSTLSRDVHELRLARVPTGDGVRYARAESGGGGGVDGGQPSLETLVPQLVTSLDGVSELLVVRTPPGGAQTVARALDGQHAPDILGTIAGDDTILVVCRSVAARERLARRVAALVGARA